jgi:hypothetical protein
MTVVPASFQIAGWLPAWWRAAVGGDDVLELLGPGALEALSRQRVLTAAVSAYCPELGVGVLPGPKPTTEAAVAAGEAVILHGHPGQPGALLIPRRSGWELVPTGPSRPVDLDLRRAGIELDEAVLAAEEQLRLGQGVAARTPQPATARALPPDASPQRRGLLVRAVRLWTALAAVETLTPQLRDLLGAVARATLVAYAEPVPALIHRPADRRFA